MQLLPAGTVTLPEMVVSLYVLPVQFTFPLTEPVGFVGMTAVDGAELTLGPTALVATTANV